MAVYTTGRESGLVVDVGYSKTIITPACHGYQMNELSVVSDIAGNLMTSKMMILLQEKGTVSVNNGPNQPVTTEFLDNLSKGTIEELKFQVTCVPESSDSKHYQDLLYRVSDSTALRVPADVRLSIANSTFETDDEDQCLGSIVLQCLMGLNHDVRNQVAQNIIVTGGTAMMPLFNHKLQCRIEHLLANDSRFTALSCLKLEFYQSNFHPNITTWVGASLITSLQVTFDHVVTMEAFKNDPMRVHDWTNTYFD